MIIVISPAKTQDFKSPIKAKATTPFFLQEANTLATRIQKMSIAEIQQYMNVSENIAQATHEKYAKFKLPGLKQALFAYQGDVYRDIEVQKYSNAQLQYAQKHLRIFSGLFGLLRPLDLISPYRLEAKAKGIYDFWEDKITKFLNEELKKEGGPLINLASNENFKAIQKKDINKAIINITFKENDKKGLRIVAIYSKYARGTMSNYIIKNQLQEPQKIKDFKEDGYKFEEKLSNDREFVFVRNSS